MTASQRLLLRQSECREKLNDLLGVDDRTEDQQGELERLTGEAQKLEPELRAALAAEGDATETTTAPVDAEQRERIELRGRARVGAFLLAALQGRVPSGAEAEYAAAHNAPAGHIPIDLWESDRPAVEHRASTPAPTTGTGVNVAPVQPFIYRAACETPGLSA